MTSESLKPPNPKCTVCSQASATVSVDPARATVKDLVEDVLEKQLEYNDGVTLRNESTVLYDPDFDDNLTKTFSSLGLNNKSLLTVVDERPEHPRVDLSLVLVEKCVSPTCTIRLILTETTEKFQKQTPPYKLPTSQQISQRNPSTRRL